MRICERRQVQLTFAKEGRTRPGEARSLDAPDAPDALDTWPLDGFLDEQIVPSFAWDSANPRMQDFSQVPANPAPQIGPGRSATDGFGDGVLATRFRL